MSVTLPYQPGLPAIFFILPSSILSLAVLRHVTISGFCRQNEWGLFVRGKEGGGERASERGRAPEKGGRRERAPQPAASESEKQQSSLEPPPRAIPCSD